MSINAFLSAVQFLTILPVSSTKPFDSNSLGFFPLVGLLVAALCAIALVILPDSIAAFGFVLLLSILSGGLHLDGLADSADAYMASHKQGNTSGNEAKSIFLRVAKEPTCGPIAIITLVLTLLGKWVAINALGANGISFILIAVASARIMPLLIIYSLNYAREDGLALTLQDAAKKPQTWLITSIPLIIALFVLPIGALLSIFIMLLLVFLLHYKLLNPIIGGFTGDTIGAAIEIAELLLLLAMVGFIVV